MTQIIKETVTTQGNSTQASAANPIVIPPTKVAATTSDMVQYLIYFFFGVLEVLLAFRLILKLTGASLASGFVKGIYGLTGVFITPFEGIFRRWSTQGAETTAVFEPSTVVAIIVYAVLVWGIIKLIQIFSGEKQSE
jgi:hypothetical protein